MSEQMSGELKIFFEDFDDNMHEFSEFFETHGQFWKRIVFIQLVSSHEFLSARVKELERQLNEYESMRREEQLARHAAQDRCKELEDKCARALIKSERISFHLKNILCWLDAADTVRWSDNFKEASREADKMFYRGRMLV